MSKIDDLKKRLKRVEKELEKAEADYAKKGAAIKQKKTEIKCIEADIVAEILIKNKMSVLDLTELLEEQPQRNILVDTQSISEALNMEDNTDGTI
jgi:hypothetical protein